MKKKFFSYFRIALCIVVSLMAIHASADTPEETIVKKLSAVKHPRFLIKKIEPSPIPGLYQIELSDGSLIHTTADASLFLSGDLFHLSENGEMTNLSNLRRQLDDARALQAIPATDMIVYSALGERKGYVWIFAVPDCPYCKTVHALVPELNKAGIEVRYLAFAKDGLGTEDSSILISVWCAQNRQAALDHFFSGEPVPQKQCDNPVAAQYELGKELDAYGRSSVILPNGERVVDLDSPNKILIRLQK